MSIRNFASNTFGTNAEGVLTAVPRQRFHFKISISLADGGAPIVFERVQDVSVPGYQFDTQIVNQYNKKRVIQTKLNYNPVNINFYDTFDNAFVNILKRYTKNYYNSDQGLSLFNDPASTPSPLDFSGGTNMGYNLGGERYFIPKIEIEQMGIKDEQRLTTLKNCFIQSVNGDTLAYSDSGPVLWQVQFQPESVHVENLPERRAE